MSKKAFKAAIQRLRVYAELSRVVNRGKPDEKRYYTFYRMRPIK